MPTLGVDVVILDAGRILLTKREDFEIWCLPGGGVDPGETVAQAAIREAFEETGICVELIRMVGVYSRPRWSEGGAHDILFLAKPVGGTLTPAVNEVVEMGYFEPESLPDPLAPDNRRRILDALSGVGGVVCYQDISWPFPEGLSRQDVYRLRDRSGMGRQEFFLSRFVQHESCGDTVEVEGIVNGEE